MDINIEEQKERLQAEITQLNNQLAQVDQQIATWQNQKQLLFNTVMKKIGALEVFTNLDGDKPKG